MNHLQGQGQKTSMAADGEFRHKPGALKQQNKSHKSGKHKSKGQLKKEDQGL